jgi:hypothetical protein
MAFTKGLAPMTKIAAAVLLLFAVSSSSHIIPVLVYAQSMEARGTQSKLTAKEESLLRNVVYTKGVSTAIPSTGPWIGKRLVVVAPEISAAHDNNRIATLLLLLDIIRGGNPHDAIAAAAIATALEDNPFVAVLIADCRVKDVDFVAEVSDQTLRKNWVASLQAKIISKHGGADVEKRGQRPDPSPASESDGYPPFIAFGC